MKKRNLGIVFLALFGLSAAAIGSSVVLLADDAPWWQFEPYEELPADSPDSPPEMALATPEAVANGWQPESSGQVIVESFEMQIQSAADAEAQRKREQLRRLGYVEGVSVRARHLLALQAGPVPDAARGLRANAMEIELAFARRAGQAIPAEAVIGYEPAGARTPDGWTGLTTVFMDRVHGACVYTVNHAGLVGGGVRLAAEDTTYEVRGKATQFMVEGSQESGFAYELAWFEPGVFHELTCALPSFDRQHQKRLIALARRLDAGQP